MDYLSASAIQEIRERIYRGPGYHVWRGYLEPARAEHIQRFWRDHGHPPVRGFRKERHLRWNGPDRSVRFRDVENHFNFFWNPPLDPPSGAAAWHLQALRNQLEGRPPDHGYLGRERPPGEKPWRRYAASYRVVETRAGGAVEPHRDWHLDHSRLQMALMLSSHGEDYSEGGLLFADRLRDGEPRNLCRDEELRAGDLVIFRYAHRHGVEAVRTAPGGRGFCRMLMPHELLWAPVEWRRLLSAKRAAAALKAPGRALREAGGAEWSRRLPLLRGLSGRAAPALRSQSEAFYYDERIARLMDIAVREGLDPSHVFNHRGLLGRFDQLQAWQMEVLEKQGLRPEHHFLDIGCGILRLGLRLIEWLEDDRYCGIDPVREYLELGRVYVRELLEAPKSFRLHCSQSFEFGHFERHFDFAMAHSVFTHLSFEQIEACFAALRPVMRPGGRLVFTVLLGRESEQSVVSAHGVPMTKSAHRDRGFYEALARRLGFHVEWLGPQGHPTQQTGVAVF